MRRRLVAFIWLCRESPWHRAWFAPWFLWTGLCTGAILSTHSLMLMGAVMAAEVGGAWTIGRHAGFYAAAVRARARE